MLCQEHKARLKKDLYNIHVYYWKNASQLTINP